MTEPTAYDLTNRDGKVLNLRTSEMLLIAERRFAAWLGLTGVEVVLSQGSYTSANPASAGTHAGGGALDVDPTSWDTAGERDRIVLELRRIGFAAWYRPRLVRADGSLVWNPHIHAIAIGDRELSTAAADQVADYYAGRNGLVNNGPDNGPRVEFTVYPQSLQEIGMPTVPEIWAHKLVNPYTKREQTAATMLRYTYGRVANLLARIGALEALVAKLADAIAADAGDTTAPTLEQLREAARAGAVEALAAGIDVRIDVDVDDQEPALPAPPATQ